MIGDDQRIADLSRAAEAIIAGPPEFLRAFVGDEGGLRQQRRAVIVASLRQQENDGRVGVSVDELAADLEAVLRLRGQAPPDDVRGEVVEVLRQLEGWQAVDGGLAPERAERDGLRRRVERDYALARSLRVFLPHWDEVQRALRRRYISLSANYFAQAIAALDTLLDELHYEDTDPLRTHTAWQSLRQALHGIITESRDFARELRSLRVDGNHPEVLADIADRLGVLHEKFFRVAAEGAAQVRERLERLRDERHEGANVRRLQETLRTREEEWSVGLGETEDERRERLDAVAHEVLHELWIFERLMAENGPGSWREAAKAISLALVDLTERIHSAISLRLQQTQAIAALLRRARDLATGGPDATQRARQYLWNASGAVHAAVWVQQRPSSDDQVRLDRWLHLKGGSPLPLVDEDTWRKSILPRHRPAPPAPPSALVTGEDWDPGEDPRMREQEEARARLVERMIAAGSAEALTTLESFDELRLLASLLWLPRDSAPLRRLGLKISPAAAGTAARAVLRGPEFEVELDNYRFHSLAAARRAGAAAEERPAASVPLRRLAASQPTQQHPPRPMVVREPQRAPASAAAAPAAMGMGSARQQGSATPVPVSASPPIAARPTPPDVALPTHPLPPDAAQPTHPLDDSEVYATRPLPALPQGVRPTHPLQPPDTLPASPQPREQPPVSQGQGQGRKLWPFGRGRGKGDQHDSARDGG
ncbi:MAG TPA: hypothetical protein VFU88_22410 [Ktedonobacterales bacterium]|nr:hypothetical protein [Ktedonobacterales bacterium]